MPKVGSEQDYKDKKTEFPQLEEGEYVFEILGFEEKAGTFHAQYNPDTIPDIVTHLKPIEDAEDPEAELRDEKGNPVHPSKYINFYIKGTFDNPRGLGFGSAGPGKARRLIWGALGISIKEPLNFNWDDLIGKRVIASITNGDKYEKVETIRPLPRKKARDVEDRPRRKPALVQAAEDIFNEDEPEF